MARTPKAAASPSRSVRLPTAIGLVVAGVIVVGLLGLRHRLLAQAQYADVKARVVLASAPRWLWPDVAKRVRDDIQAAAGGRSVFEPELARDVHAAAAANVWTARVVGVTKHADGRVVVEARFRKPYAVVQTVRNWPVLDREGVVLPVRLARIPANSLVIIAGVKSSPPEPGKVWDAPDLADGLKLRRLIEGRPYVREITCIDVRNHRRRVSQLDPELVLIAQVARGSRTVIRFGRFPVEGIGDYCVSPAQKLQYLDAYYRRNGSRLAGGRDFIELRYDDPYASIR